MTATMKKVWECDRLGCNERCDMPPNSPEPPKDWLVLQKGVDFVATLCGKCVTESNIIAGLKVLPKD